MLTSLQWTLLLIGTLLTAAGFIDRPRAWVDLIRPRFIVPLIFWTGTFYSCFSYVKADVADPDGFTYYRRDYGTEALLYLVLCLGVFWLGYLVPWLERRIRTITTLENPLFLVPVYQIRMFSLFVALAAAGMLVYSLGFAVLQNASGLIPLWIGSGFKGYLVGQVVPLAGWVSALCLGLSWPDRQERSSNFYLLALAIMFFDSMYSMAFFSRGAGLVPPLVVLGFMLRHHRIPWISAIMAIFWAVLCAHAALSGRAFYGHFGGVLPFLSHFFTSMFEWSEAGASATRAMDGYTPLTVTMSAINNAIDLHPLTPAQWLIFQIPIPSFFAKFLPFYPEWTFDITYAIGGVGTWGYTTAIYGDTFGHFSWFGCLTFFPVGMFYRGVNGFFTRKLQSHANLLVLALPTSYVAFAIGNFNTYRSWVSQLFFPIVGLIVIAWLIRLFFGRRSVMEGGVDMRTEITV